MIFGFGVVGWLTSLITTTQSINEHAYQMEKEGLKIDLLCMRIIVQNGKSASDIMYINSFLSSLLGI